MADFDFNNLMVGNASQFVDPTYTPESEVSGRESLDFFNDPSITTHSVQQSPQPYSVAPTVTERNAVDAVAVDPTEAAKVQAQSAALKTQADPNISSREYDPEIEYRGSTGYTYARPKESHMNDAILGAAGWLQGYLMNGNAAEGMSLAGQMVSMNQDRVHRFKQIDYLESQGYNPKDIDAFVLTGDQKVLQKNKQEYINAGGGKIFNPATGQFISDPNAAKTVTRTVDLGNRTVVYYSDGSQESLAKGVAPHAGGASASGTWIPLGNGYAFNNKSGLGSLFG